MANSARKPFIAGNWKMYNTLKESLELVSALKKGLNTDGKIEVLIAPSFTSLREAAKEAAGSGILVAGQDCCWEPKGAFTGAVSPAQLKDAGATHVILGHSERRAIFGETDAMLAKKIKAALAGGLVPIFCVGETLAEREANKTYRVLETQLSGGLAGFSAAELAPLIVAYEPVWAIGTGKTATPQQAQDAHLFIRKRLENMFGPEFASAIRLLYGGSVKPDNVDYLMAEKDVDGALVGGASLKAADFLRIAHFEKVLTGA